MKIFLIFIIILVVLILVVGTCVYLYITRPKRITHEDAENTEKSKGFWGDFDSYDKEELNITCRDGYVLHGTYVKASASSNKYAIITHGYTYCSAGSVKYANIFYKLGYNVYIYDIRHHGLNKSTYCSMGRNEGADVADVYDYFRNKYGKDAIIGLHGESLGCASSIIALGMRDDIDFLVADCGFADFNQLAYHLSVSTVHLPGFVSHFASIISLILHGFRLDKVRPVDAFKNNDKTPVLFIHGADDDFIPKLHSEENYEACNANKKLIFFDGAGHAQSYQVDPERYFKEVETFLGEFVSR